MVKDLMLKAKTIMTWSSLLITAVFLTGCVSNNNGSLQPPASQKVSNKERKRTR